MSDELSDVIGSNVSGIFCWPCIYNHFFFEKVMSITPLVNFQAKGIDIRSWERDELMQFINGQGFNETKGMVNYK